MKKSSEKKNDKELKDDKVVIENLTDLLKIPFSKLNNTKLSNFSGKYFDEIYQEALKVERGEINQQQQNIQNNMPNFQEQNENNNQDQDDHFFENSVSSHNNNMYMNQNINMNKMTLNNQNINTNNNVNNMKMMNNNMNNDRLTDDSASYTQGLTLQKLTFEIVYPTVFGEEIGILGSGQSLGNWKQDKVIKLKWNKGNIWKGSIPINEYNLSDFEFKFVLLSNNKIKQWESGGNNIVNFNNIYQEVVKRRNGRFSKYNYEYLEDELVLKCKWT